MVVHRGRSRLPQAGARRLSRRWPDHSDFALRGFADLGNCLEAAAAAKRGASRVAVREKTSGGTPRACFRAMSRSQALVTLSIRTAWAAVRRLLKSHGDTKAVLMRGKSDP